MNILCYGGPSESGKEHCEFFQGADCCAEWATEIQRALTLLSVKPFDCVVFDRSISASQCNMLAEMMRSVRPTLAFFSLAAMEEELHKDSNPPSKDEDQWSSLVSVYVKLSSRGRNSNVRSATAGRT